MREFLRYLYVVAAMLMVVVGDVWAGKAKVNAKSNPEEGGYVYVANSAGSYSPNSSTDDATQDGDFWSSKDKDFYLYYKVSDSKYYFKGWYKTDVNWLSQWNSCDANSTTLTTNGQKVTHKADGGATTADYYYYAIFATLHNTTSPSFSTINVDKTTTATVTLKHAHANNVTLSITGDCASDFSVNTTSFYSNQLGTQTITITFNPNCAGTRTANLKITNDNGLPEVNIPLSAVANALPQTIAWDSQYDENLNVGGTLVVSATASTGQSVTYASSDPSVISVSGNTLTALKEGVATITASQIDGCTYETVHTQLEFKVYNKKTPVFWLMGDPNMESDNLKVEDSRWIKIENVDGMRAVYDPNLLSYSFDGDRVVVTALDAGVATLELIQDPTDAIFGKSRTFTFNITKYTTNTISNDLAIQYMVDDVIPEIDIYTINNMEVPVQVISGDENILKFENGQLKAVGAGITTVTVLQAETNKWVGISASKTIEVIKHTPEFTWNLPVYYNREVADFFSTTGSNALTYSSSDEDVATLSTGSNAQKLNLTTYNKEASTTITIIQAENYYWYGKTETKVVTPIDPNNHVPFVVTENNDNEVFIKNSYYGCKWNNGVQVGDGNGGFDRDNAKFILIEFSGIPDKLIFDYEPREVHITNTTTHPDDVFWFVQESTTNEGEFDGSGKNPFWDNKEYIWSTTSKNAGKTDSIQLSPNTKFIRLGYWGNFGTAFKNITVTEREEFHAVDNSDNEVEHLYFDANQVFTDKTLSFNLKYANAGYKVKVESNDSRFTVNPTSIITIGGCKYGKENISVTYRSTTPYETTGNNSYIVISDELAELNGHRDTVYLHASSYKPTQQLEWRADFKAVDKPTVCVKDGEITNAATASSGLPVTYTSSDTTVIAVRNAGTVLLPKAAGEATITALQAGNETWQPVGPITKNFIVTDKIIQYIVWSDDLTDLIVGGDNVNLTAKVYLQNEETKQWEEHPELTEKLVYTIDNTSVVSVAGNVLSIHSIGQTTATVTAPGNTDYAVATLTKPVRVRSAAAGCEDVLLLNHRDEVRFFAYNLDQIVQGEFAIDHTKGVPGTLSFQHSGASWDLGIQYYAGKIRAEYNTTDDSNWVLAKEVTPTEDQTNLEFDIPLPRNASKIRFVRPAGGQGYHYVSNIQVHPAQYIEAVETIDLGEIHVGSIEDTTFVVNYANIKDDVYLTASSGTVTTNPTSFGEQCGEFGTKTITVQWIPSEVNANAQETVTLTDGVSGTTCVVKLIANVTPGTQNLYWQDRPTVISNCGDIEFPEQTTAHIDIIWEVVSGQEVADFVDGRLELYKSGTIIVRGYNAGNANYHPFEITYTFTINYDPVFLGTEDTDWNNVDNWNICRLPNENDIVTIKALVELVTHEKVKGMKFAENGKMHIAHNAGMTIGSHGLELTTNGLITIDNTPDGAGFLKVDPNATNKPNGKVTIKYITKAYNSGVARDEIWQYMGAPGSDMQMSDADKTMIYHWNEQQGWLKMSNTNLQPFVGYAFTQNKAQEASFQIQATPIIPDKVQEIPLTVTSNGMRGSNLFVNSFLAPIDLATFDDKDFTDGVEQTFYLYNSGSWNQWQNQGGADNVMKHGVSPGQYYALSLKGAELMDPQYDQTTIPPMQGVYVVATKDGASIKLDYTKHVYAAEASNQAMRAPQRQDDNFKRVRLQVSGKNSGADRMYVIQHNECTSGYDNGYDAKNMPVASQVSIYTSEVEGQMEISVSDKIDSTYIGFRAGADSEYTLRITSVVGEGLYLKDLDNQTLISVYDGEEYTFSAEPNSVNDRRFLLLDQRSDDVSTDEPEVRVYVHDKMAHVLGAPIGSDMVIYTIGGVAITNYTIECTPSVVDLSSLPTGVYVLRINDKAFKCVCK